MFRLLCRVELGFSIVRWQPKTSCGRADALRVTFTHVALYRVHHHSHHRPRHRDDPARLRARLARSSSYSEEGAPTHGSALFGPRDFGLDGCPTSSSREVRLCNKTVQSPKL